VLIILMHKYAGTLNVSFGIQAAGFVAGAGVLLAPESYGLVSRDVLALAQTSSILIFAASKVPQIWTSYANKSTGQLAPITCFLNFSGALARTFTIVKEAPDPLRTCALYCNALRRCAQHLIVCVRVCVLLRCAVIAGAVSGAFFNGMIMLQFVLYRNNSAAPKTPAAPAAADATTDTAAKGTKQH
jgi:hypothetical protein